MNICIYFYFDWVGKFCSDITPTSSRAKWEYYMKAWNYIKNGCDQETDKGYSTTVKIIGKSDCVPLGFPGKTGLTITESPDHRIKDHQTKDEGSVQNASNKLNKLIGMIDCSSTWLSQDLSLLTNRRCFFSPSPVRRLSRYPQEL